MDCENSEVNYLLEHVVDYYPYGKVLREHTNCEDARYLTTHHERDKETDLDYRGARFYDSDIGRFLSLDPLAMDFPAWSDYNYVLGNPVRLIDEDGKSPIDPKLSFNALNTNPNYMGLTTGGIRAQVRSAFPDLADWQVNISAGNALESAYGNFTRENRGHKMLSTYGDITGPSSVFKMRSVKPDFIHATTFSGSDGKPIIFHLGGIVEVKAPAGSIELNTNNNQIDAEINLAKYASGNDGKIGHLFGTRAHEVNAGSFTLVLPYGAQIGKNLIETATKRGVNLYVSYAFQNIETGNVVFSTPQKLNQISNENIYNFPGKLSHAGPLNVDRATRWAREMNRNPTNNGRNE